MGLRAKENLKTTVLCVLFSKVLEVVKLSLLFRHSFVQCKPLKDVSMFSYVKEYPFKKGFQSNSQSKRMQTYGPVMNVH